MILHRGGAAGKGANGHESVAGNVGKTTDKSLRRRSYRQDQAEKKNCIIRGHKHERNNPDYRAVPLVLFRWNRLIRS